MFDTTVVLLGHNVYIIDSGSRRYIRFQIGMIEIIYILINEIAALGSATLYANKLKH